MRCARAEDKMNRLYDTKRIGTIVIGGGQAGLSVGYHLAKRRQPFLILDANRRIGDAWRNRWDSLRLFTPARYVGLPGFPFPARGDSFPTKDDMASYLEQYARRFDLPVQTGARVERLTKQGERFVLTTAGERFEADNIVVAMADYQAPRTPEFAANLDKEITQLHSQNYRNPSQLQNGGVLIVGVGNSGADIAMEVSRTHRTWLSGTESGHIPWPIESFVGRFVLIRLMRFLGHHILTAGTRIGRKIRPTMLARSAPLVRVKPKDLIAAGITRVPRVAGVSNGQPLLADGRVLNVSNVIWCTGYHHSFPWIDLPIFTQDGRPVHDRGVVPGVKGLYFVGLHFLYSMTSATLIGVGRDAAHIAGVIESRTRIATLESQPRVAKAG
jgi:putative flavoprotein involved in K+ transport